MLIPLSWTVAETVTVPARKREKRERWRGGMEARWRECEQNRDGEGSGS